MRARQALVRSTGEISFRRSRSEASAILSSSIIREIRVSSIARFRELDGNTDLKITRISTQRRRLLRDAGRIVNHKRRCERRILRSQEVDTNGLSSECRQVERPERVSSRLVQI